MVQKSHDSIKATLLHVGSTTSELDRSFGDMQIGIVKSCEVAVVSDMHHTQMGDLKTTHLAGTNCHRPIGTADLQVLETPPWSSKT